MRNTTFNLPPELLAKAKAYAARNGTSMTAIVREHLQAVTAESTDDPKPDALLAFSKGLVSRADTLEAVGLRDYAELLVTLGEHALVPPRPPEHQIQNEAVTFERVWREA